MEANKSILKFYDEFKRVALSFQLITNPLQYTDQGFSCRVFNKKNQSILILLTDNKNTLNATVIEYHNLSLKNFVEQLLNKLLNPIIQIDDVPLLLKKRKQTFDLTSKDTLNAIYISTHGENHYFGPQIVSAIHLDTKTYHSFLKEGFSNWTYLSPNEITHVTQQLKTSTQHAVIRLGNESYNAIYDKMGNHYHILAWSFARIIETIQRQGNIDIAIIPPFDGSLLIQDLLISKGIDVTIQHASPPEHLLGYHLAKCMAVSTFKEELTRLESILKLPLPLTPDYAVIDTALLYAKEHGIEGLRKIAKYHYPITSSIKKEIPSS